MDEKKNFFETKIRPLLVYVGTAGAILSTIGYIIAVFVLIFGFKQDIENSQLLIFAIANALVGLIIMFFLKIQGKDFAKNLKENKLIEEEYYGHKTKDKKIRSMKFFWIKSTITDVCTKSLTVFASTYLIVKIVMIGNGDLSLLGLAAVNVIMFICFGLLSLVKAYDFYNNYHVKYMLEQLKISGIELKNEAENAIIISEEKGEQTNA